MTGTVDGAAVCTDSRLLTSSASSGKRLEQAGRISLKRNAAWTIAGNGFYAATQWLQVAVIAHLGGSSDVGYFSLALGYTTPVFMLTNLQLRALQATDASRTFSFGEYLALRLVSSAVAIAALLLIACAPGSSARYLLVMAMAGYKGFESLSDIYQGFLQQRERMDYVAGSFILKGSLVLCALALTYWCTQSLLCAVSAMVAAQLLTLATYDMKASTRLARHAAFGQRPVWNWGAMRILALRALPLGIAMMLISLYASVPRFVLQKYVGPSAVGVFSAVTYLSMVGSMITTAVGAAIAPRMAEYAISNVFAFHRLAIKLVSLAGGLGVAGLCVSSLAGRWALRTFYGLEYSHYTDVLLWSMSAATLTYITSGLGFAATARGRLAGQLPAVGLSTAALLAACLLLIPRYGLVGAAMAGVVASAISLVGYILLVFRGEANDRLR